MDRARSVRDNATVYSLTLDPLRRDPDLIASVLYGLKFSLGVMFGDPFRVRDVVVAIRELLDNIVAHADWEQTPAPSLSVVYGVRSGVPQFCIGATNMTKDIDEATRAVARINEFIGDGGSLEPEQRLTRCFIEPATLDTCGGTGLLQVASSRRCHLEVRLEDSSFYVRVDVDVPELRVASRR